MHTGRTLMSDQSAQWRAGAGLPVKLLDATPTRFASFNGILDSDQLGDVKGLEILGFRNQLGDISVPAPPLIEGVRPSYDAEMDAFYVKLGEGTATHQEKVEGQAGITEDNVVVSFMVRRAVDRT